MASTTNEPDASIADKFGRSPYFVIYDSDLDEVTVIANPGAQAEHGAGSKAAKAIVSNGVAVVFAKRFGPTAERVLQSANVKTVVVSESRKIKEYFQEYQPSL